MTSTAECKETKSPSLQSVKTPRHIAIIMDGNGRWAQQRGWKRSFGHVQGCVRVKEIVREAGNLGIEVLTLYCFSTENWNRPSDEIDALMSLLRDYLISERQEFIDNKIRIRVLGEIDRISPTVREVIDDTLELTKNFESMTVNLCLSYGGRAELVRAAQMLCREVQAGTLNVSDVNEREISSRLWTAGMIDPDLVIRTSGEFRISNFLLWQLAYSEFYITDTLWPDFEAKHLRAAIESYTRRDRRYGLSDEARIKDIASVAIHKHDDRT